MRGSRCTTPPTVRSGATQPSAPRSRRSSTSPRGGTRCVAPSSPRMRAPASTSTAEHGDAATEFALANGFRQTLLDLRQDLALPVREETPARLDPGTDPTAYVIETAVDALPEEWLED